MRRARHHPARQHPPRTFPPPEPLKGWACRSTQHARGSPSPSLNLLFRPSMRKGSRLMTANTLDTPDSLQRFGYRQELRRTLNFADLVVLRPGVHGGHRTVRDLRQRVPSLRRDGGPRLRGRGGGDDADCLVVRADDPGVPDGRVGVRLRRAGDSAVGGFPGRVDDPAGLHPHPEPAVAGRSSLDDRDRAGDSVVGLDRDLRRGEHGAEPVRDQEHTAVDEGLSCTAPWPCW